MRTLSERELSYAWGLVKGFNFQAAESRLKAMRELVPSDPRPLDALAQVYRLTQRHVEAMDAARDLARMCPTRSRSHGLLAYVLNGATRHAEGAEAAREAIRLSPTSVLGYWQAAIAADGLGHLVESVHWARQGLAHDPSNVSLRQRLGMALGGLGQAAEAEHVVADYLRQEPADPFNQTAAGWTYLRLNWLDRAAERFLAALEMQPNYPWQHEGLGIVRYKQGRFDEARRLLTEAARLDPAIVEGRRILDQLNAEQQERGSEADLAALKAKLHQAAAELELGEFTTPEQVREDIAELMRLRAQKAF